MIEPAPASCFNDALAFEMLWAVGVVPTGRSVQAAGLLSKSLRGI